MIDRKGKLYTVVYGNMRTMLILIFCLFFILSASLILFLGYRTTEQISPLPLAAGLMMLFVFAYFGLVGQRRWNYFAKELGIKRGESIRFGDPSDFGIIYHGWTYKGSKSFTFILNDPLISDSLLFVYDSGIAASSKERLTAIPQVVSLKESPGRTALRLSKDMTIDGFITVLDALSQS
jgi:hypothetical protein